MKFAKFIKFSESDRDPNAPHLSLELDAPAKLSLTLPFRVGITLRYKPASDDAEDVLVQWDKSRLTASSIRLLVLQETDNGFKKVELEDSDRPPSVWKDEKAEENTDSLSKDCAFKKLSPSKPYFETRHKMPGRFYDPSRLGKTYVVLWPGGEIKWWDGGDVTEHEGGIFHAKENELDPRPPLVLPASNAVTFTVGEEPDVWSGRAAMEERGTPIEFMNFAESMYRSQEEYCRPRSPFPIVPESDRIPGAPVLSVTLTGSTNVALKYHGSSFSVTLTYHKSSSEDNRPITICSENIWRGIAYGCLGFAILHHSPRGLERLQQLPAHEEFSLPVITIGESNKYHTLYPGESYTDTSSILSNADFYNSSMYKPGERFTYRFSGGEISWWDWGTKEDHRDIRVGEETHSESRPKIILPASNDHDYVIVES